jgi:hypothetical protein
MERTYNPGVSKNCEVEMPLQNSQYIKILPTYEKNSIA